ncbi:MAG: hypothetical protein AAF388_09580 [Bacteroidota bacterium]
MTLLAFLFPFLLTTSHDAQEGFSDFCLIDSEESVVWEMTMSSSEEELSDYKIELESGGHLKLYTPTHVILGTWEYGVAALNIHIPENEPISEILNNSWYIERPNLDQVVLESTCGDITINLMIPKEKVPNSL